MKNIKIALVDDETLFRNGMRMIIERFEGIEVVLDAGSGTEFLTQLKALETVPEVVLLDLKMPDMNGMEVAKQLVDDYPAMYIIVLSLHFSKAFVTHMIELGASAYLAKSVTPEVVENTIRSVVQNGFHYSNEVTAMMREALQDKTQMKPSFDSTIAITRREREVLELICQQKTNHEIAEQLFVSPRTVAGHRNNLLSKTGVRNTAGLVIFALQSGIYRLGEANELNNLSW